MKLRLLSITHKIPTWVNEAFQDYAKRLPHYLLEPIDIAAEKRGTNCDINQIRERESNKLLASTKPHHLVIALDMHGKHLTTEMLAQQVANWQMDGQTVNFLIGGPDGLSQTCLKKANWCWSLSKLTFPHFLVRLIIIEQIYRVHSLLIGHPYHR